MKTGRLGNIAKTSGFTLIELVVVIAIVGILAAFAFPRFISMQTDARIAKMNGALGSIKAAAAMAHAQLLTQGYSSSYTNVASPFSIEGVAVIYTNGYPTAATIMQLAGIAAPDYNLPAIVGTTASATPDATHAACTVSYTEPAAGGNPPVYSNAGLTAANCQ